jgi:DNA repair photolyase
MEKIFNGKAVYCPKGKASEYAKWACNLYNSCSGQCTYCYCKSLLRGIWSDVPTLKKSLVNEAVAMDIFKVETKKNISELQKHGLHFNFVSDPFLKETIHLNIRAMVWCIHNDIPVKALTKQTWWIDQYMKWIDYAGKIAFGFTLTDHDEMEPGCAPNIKRVKAMQKIHDMGHLTWASIEPIIQLDSSLKMIRSTAGYCDLYKIGLKSGSHLCSAALDEFINIVISENPYSKIYFKDSLLEQAGIRRELLPANNCVTRNYNIFNGTDNPD